MADFQPLSRADLEQLLEDLPGEGLGSKAVIVEEVLRTALYYEGRAGKAAGQTRKAQETYAEKRRLEAERLGISVYELRKRKRSKPPAG